MNMVFKIGEGTDEEDPLDFVNLLKWSFEGLQEE